jgi:glycine betaine/proline transport system permease protein
MDWLSDAKIPIGYGIRLLVDFLNTYFAWLFDGISFVLGGAIDAVVDLLQAIPPLALIGLIAALGWRLQRSPRLALAIVLGLLLIVNLGYWKETTETLALVVAATAISMALGVPIGIAAAHRPRLYAALRPVLDMMQTIPTFVYLIPTLILFGLGVVPGLISTIVFAVPAPIRLTQLGVSGVPRELHEAGEAFGATPRQLLWKV